MRIVSLGLILGLFLPTWTFAAPTVARIIPPPGSTIHALTDIEVLFEDAVTNVDAGDLLINGAPATTLIFGVPGQFVFEFPQPATGTVQVAWAANNGITDLSDPPQPFAGGSWTYVLDPNAATAALLLNEFMADNNNTLHDEDGDSSDWLEIYNPGAVQVNIGGWFLTDDSRRLSKWRFPDGKTIPANGFLVVFASGKDRTNILGRLHTNFKLSANAGYLALVNPTTNVVSDYAPSYPAQTTDVSYGRVAGSPTVKGYFTTPTPGAANQTAGLGFSPEVTFSRPSGTFLQTSPFALTLSTPLTNAVIYYAFGTNVPGTNTTRYTGPLTIDNTRMIRARAFAPGLLPGPVTTKTYVALASSVLSFKSHLPIMVLHNYGQGTVPASKTEQYVIVQTFEPEFGQSSMTNTPDLAEFGTFHVRGSSTAVDSTSKAAFAMEVQDEFRNDKEVPLLGLPQESDWVLYAPNNFEPVSYHNPMAFQLARDLGEYASRTRFMEVYLKDDSGAPGPITSADYYGLFVLEEKIKRDNHRVNIAKLEPENVTQPTVSGGYIWSVDRAATGEATISFPGAPLGSATLNWIDPNGFEITNAARLPQRVYVTNYLVQLNTALTNAGWTNPVSGYAAYIDVDSWVRRHIHEVVTHNIDGLRLSGYLFKDRDKKIEYGPAWDYDRTQGSTDGRDFNPRVFRSRIPDLGTDYFNPQSSGVPWWGKLFTSPDFWQRWIDKYQEFRDGPLSLTNISAHADQFAADVRPAYPRETNRWGTTRFARVGNVTADNFTYNFGSVRDYDNEVRWTKAWYSNRLDFIDTNFLARPTLSRPAGTVTSGQTVTLSPATEAGTTVFYTLNGTDPRLPSGGILPSALSSTTPVDIIITSNIELFARCWNPAHSNLTGPNNPPISSPWSGVRQGVFYTQVPALRITEIMYHPQNPIPNYTNDANFEYLELKNIGATPLNVNGFKISGGLDFVLPDVTLAPGQAGVIVANQNQFIQRYGSGKLILGQYAGDYFGEKTNVLNNGGDHLVLTGSLGEPILDFDYHDDWYPITDGFGFSLVIVDENAATSTWGLKESWRPSGLVDGSPGGTDPLPPVLPRVVISEALTHSEPAYDAIELQNLSATSADISGWFLTDNFQTPRKFRIPDGTVIPPGGFAVFDETQFNIGAEPFTLSSLGDDVFVFSGDPVTENLTGYYHGFDFGPAEKGRSFGRYVTSTGDDHFPPQMATTLGASNAGPLVGPVVISEINYRPWDVIMNGFTNDNSLDEYIELHNITSTNVPLYDPNHPANTWALDNGVQYTFPLGVVLPPNGYLLAVNFDPTDASQVDAFRAHNYVPASVPLYGPYSGKLDNAGEAIELRRPGTPQPSGPPDFGLVPSILVERIRYSDLPPWPTNADGLGLTLQRVVDTAYGNDPANWMAGAGTPGGPVISGPPPQITSQPADTSVFVSYDANFAVQASGANLRYQWLYKGNPIQDATNSTFHLSYVELPNGGEYSVAVLGAGGRAVSRSAVLTVLTNAAVIVAQPQDVVAILGSNATIRATISTAGPVTYQWFFNGTAIPGATASNYTITSVTLDSAGSYFLRISDATASIFTRPATLTVTVPPLFVVLPQSQYVPSNGSVTVSVIVTNNATLPITYRWRRIGGGGVTNVNSLATTDFFAITNVTSSNRYDVIVFNVARPNGLQMTPPFFVAPIPDTDNDGIPDAWELQYGLNINNPLDANGDLDGDGMSNLAEYIAGTDPTDPNSYLFVDLVSAAGGPATAVLRFNAVSNRTYTVQYRDSLTGPATPLQNVSSGTTNRIVEVIDSSPNASSRFYQLVTPKQQ